MVNRVPGKHKRISSLKYLDRIIHLDSKRPTDSVVLIRTAGFEDPQVSDSATLREVGMDLQEYATKFINPGVHHTISAIYLHLLGEASPSPLTQRNFRAVRQLCQQLGYIDFSLFIMLAPAQVRPSVSSLTQVPYLYTSEDFNLWSENLAFRELRSVSHFLKSSLDRQRSPAYTRPALTLNQRSLEETFLRIDTDYWNGLRMERAHFMKQVEQVKQEVQQAEIKATTAEAALLELTVQHNTLLQNLNLHDNTELSNIVHRFRVLNEHVDGLALEIARMIPSQLWKRFPSCEKCFNPGLLRHGFGVRDIKPLILESQDGRSMPSRQFLELFNGSILCHTLQTLIFCPFYPLMPSDQEGNSKLQVFEQVYAHIQSKNERMVTAKWRIDTYLSLFELDSSREERPARLASHAADAINSAIHCLFGTNIKHLGENERLVDLFKRALEFNHTIKAEVAHAGEIYVECFHLDEPYDGSRMKVLDSSTNDPIPTHIVCTCGLGLGVAKSGGKGDELELVNLLKAIVADATVYE